MAKAASNISFLYFLENDIKNAEKYAEIAIDYDRYNVIYVFFRPKLLWTEATVFSWGQIFWEQKSSI